MKAQENLIEFRGWNAGTVIFYLDGAAAAVGMQAELHAIAGGAEADWVLQQVRPYQLKIVGVGAHKNGVVAGELDGHVAFMRYRPEALDCVLAGRSDVDRFQIVTGTAGGPLFRARQTQH